VTLAGLTLYGGTLAAADATAKITGSVNYSSPNVSTFNGSIAGSGTLTVTAGELVLNGNNTYSGATTVSAATLSGTGTLTSIVTVTSGRIRGGSGTSIGTLTVGGLNVAGGGITALLASNGTNSKLAIGSGVLNLSTGSTLQLQSVAGFADTPASYTIASLSDGNNLKLDNNSVTDQFVFGTYSPSSGASGSVVIDMSQFSFPLTTSDRFTLSRSGNNLVLNFSTGPVPEPGLLLALGIALAGIGSIRGRDRT
jgi:hypothetical protein